MRRGVTSLCGVGGFSFHAHVGDLGLRGCVNLWYSAYGCVCVCKDGGYWALW